MVGNVWHNAMSPQGNVPIIACYLMVTWHYATSPYGNMVLWRVTLGLRGILATSPYGKNLFKKKKFDINFFFKFYSIQFNTYEVNEDQ
jgi:hypothetical protein